MEAHRNVWLAIMGVLAAVGAVLLAYALQTTGARAGINWTRPAMLLALAFFGLSSLALVAAVRHVPVPLLRQSVPVTGPARTAIGSLLEDAHEIRGRLTSGNQDELRPEVDAWIQKAKVGLNRHLPDRVGYFVTDVEPPLPKPVGNTNTERQLDAFGITIHYNETKTTALLDRHRERLAKIQEGLV